MKDKTRHFHSRFLLATACVFVACAPAWAALSVAEIQELIREKYSDQVIAARIRAEGVSFRVDKDVMDQLRKAGASDDLLVEVVNRAASQGTAPSPRNDNAYEAAREAVRQQQLTSAVDILNRASERRALSGREQFLLAVILVRQGDRDSALRQINALKSSPELSNQKLGVRAEQYVHDAQVLREGLESSFKAAADLRIAEAESQLEKLTLKPDQRLAAIGQMKLLKGEIQQARESFSKMAPSTATTQLLKRADEWQKLLDKVNSRLSWYYDQASAICCEVEPRFDRSSRYPEADVDFADLGELISILNSLTPISPDAMSKRFHWLLISGSYEELAEFGERVLNATGQLRIPFVSDDSRFNLVLSRTEKRLFVDDVVKPAVIAYFNTGLHKRGPANFAVDVSTLSFSSIGFDEITEISQSASSTLMTYPYLQINPVALKINRKYVLPEWLFMEWSQCLLGAERQKLSTRNLAEFIEKAGGLKLKKKSLVDAKPESHMLTAVLAAGAKAYAANSDSAILNVAALQTGTALKSDFATIFQKELDQMNARSSQQAVQLADLPRLRITNSIEDLVLVDLVAEM